MALCGKGAVKQCIPQTPFTASDQPDLDDDTIQSLDDASGKKNQTIRILHVEDDPTVAGLIQEIASQEGWELDHCLEGNAALEELAGHTEYDLVIVDYELPGLNGLELIEQVRSMFHRQYVPIVMLSGTLQEGAAREAGANAFLRKPQDIGLLVKTISRLLSDRDREV